MPVPRPAARAAFPRSLPNFCTLSATFVVIEEVETENWGWGGLPVPEYPRQQALK